MILSTEASIFICGVVRPVIEGQRAPGNFELVADYFEVIGFSPPGGADLFRIEVCCFSYENRIRFIRIRNFIRIFNRIIDI
jgi:asparaginyl-tRNA synthetase